MSEPILRLIRLVYRVEFGTTKLVIYFDTAKSILNFPLQNLFKFHIILAIKFLYHVLRYVKQLAGVVFEAMLLCINPRPTIGTIIKYAPLQHLRFYKRTIPTFSLASSGNYTNWVNHLLLRIIRHN